MTTRLLISSRKLCQLGFILLCVMCVCAIYLIYVDIIQPAPEGQAKKGQSYRGDFELYGGLNLQPKQSKERLRPWTTLAGSREITRKHDEVIYGDENAWVGFADGDGDDAAAAGNDDFIEEENDNAEDEEFYRDYPQGAARVNQGLNNLFPRQAYLDKELSENLQSIHEMGNKDARLPDRDAAVGVADVVSNEQDFQYPEIGYRYQNVIKEPNHLPYSKPTNVNHVTTARPANHNSVSRDPINRNTDNHGLKTRHSRHYVPKKPKRPKPTLSPVFPPAHSHYYPQGSKDTRYLVYLCNTNNMCGGWGDRQRGMAAVYLLSRVINRQFKIVMSTPCELSNFYLPNQIQWRPIENELMSASNITINAFQDKNFKFTVMEADFDQFFPQKVVYLKTNQDYYERLMKNPLYGKILKQWTGIRSKGPRFRWAWRDLMQPSPMLLSHLEHIVGPELLMRRGLTSQPIDTSKSRSTHNVGNATLLCAHVRMGKNPTIPMDEDFESIRLEDLPILLNFMSAQDSSGNASFFVASDYENVRSQAKAFFGEKLISYGGKILHIDRQRSERSACVGFEVALMDQLILTLCDILVVSRSGFSISASYLKNSTQPVYIMEDGEIKRFRE